jgi:hypothetical protein
MNVEPTGTNPTVTGAIRQAAQMTGADFKYLLATAQVESNLNPNAQASTSSAKGLFQFTEQTWLTTLKEQGGPLGYGPYANAISRQPSGEYAISDPKMTQAVLNLRSDPNANALMAGAFTKLNAGKLADRLGRGPTEGELYIAHFLGASGASRMIGLADSSPQTPAAAVFPVAARANPTIFYDGRGNARSAGDVYRNLIGRYDVARSTPANAPLNLPAIPPTAVAATAAPTASRTAFAPDTAGLTETYAAAARLSPTVLDADTGPMFHGLFRSNGGPEPISPLVNSLWSAPTASAAPAGAIKPAAPASRAAVPVAAAPVAAAPAEPDAAPQAVGGELGLFQDQVPDARALFRGRV